MRLIRWGPLGEERPGVMIDDIEFVEVDHLIGDFDETFFATDGIGKLRAALPELIRSATRYSIGKGRVGAPITRPQQIICVGLNYRDHADETGHAVPVEPVLFNKAPNTLVGPNDDVEIPLLSTKTDYEIELGVVIGTRARYLDSPEQAIRHIAGYVVVNDVSERAFQLERGGQWSKGKSCPTFNPCGPYLVTRDEVPDPQQLDMWLNVNGERRQTGNTRTMLFDVYSIVHYVSQFMTLEPGDLINTGTPPGVGMAATPPRYLNEGDVVELGIVGLGHQRQRLVTATVDRAVAS